MAPIALLAAGFAVARCCLPGAVWPLRAVGGDRSRWAAASSAVLVAATAALVGMSQAGPQTLPALVPALAGPAQVAWGLLWVGLAAPVVEELYFRGALQPALRRVAGAWLAVVLSGAVFAFAHGSGDFWWKLTMGLTFGVLSELSGGLLLPAAAHAGWNAGMVAGSVWPAAGFLALAVGIGATVPRWFAVKRRDS